LRISHQKYLNNIILPSSDNDRHCKQKLWSYIKSFRKDRADIPPLSSGTSLVTDNHQKAEALNKQFQSVFTKEHDGPIPDKGPSPHPTMPDINITAPGILKLLQNLDVHKASGPDLISSRVLKKTAEPIAPILRTIFAFFMDTSTVPDDWRNAYITPIYKKGDHSQPSNYRPILFL